MSVHLQAAWVKKSSWVIMIEHEQFCAEPRVELCEAKVGQDRHGVMLGTCRTGRFVWHSVADGGCRIEVDEEKVTADTEGAGHHCEELWLRKSARS